MPEPKVVLVLGSSYAQFKVYCKKTGTDPRGVIYVGPGCEERLYGYDASEIEIVYLYPILGTVPHKVLNYARLLEKIGAESSVYYT